MKAKPYMYLFCGLTSKIFHMVLYDLSLLFSQEVGMDLVENSDTLESEELPGIGPGPQMIKAGAVTEQPFQTMHPHRTAI